MFTELMIFAAFYAVAFVGHALSVHRKADSHRLPRHRFAFFAALVGKALAAALHEYAVHFLVYSGYVLKAH